MVRGLIAVVLLAALMVVLILVVPPLLVHEPTRPPSPGRLELPQVIKEGRELALRVAEEGVVVLKNDGVLPLSPQTRLAVFGTGQNLTWWYHAGGSSFVPLDPQRVVTLLEAFLEYGLEVDLEVSRAYNPWPLPAKTNECPFTEEDIKRFALRNDVAIIVISRYASEDFDLPQRGGWFSAGWWFYYYTSQLSGAYYFRGWELEEDEVSLIDMVAKHFERAVLILNTPHAVGIASVVDKVDAILWVGYPGEVGGYAVANTLLGLSSPSGKLPFTWASRWEDYPSSRCWGSEEVVYCESIYVGYRYFDTFNVEPLFPFGFGLSYASFEIDLIRVTLEGTEVILTVRVVNVGQYPGKEVIQVYTTLPPSGLEKECQRLVAFAKTDLLRPGESQTITVSFDIASAASFSEEDGTWVLEEGSYLVKVGSSSRDARVVARVVMPRAVAVEKASVRLRPGYFYRKAKEMGIEILHRPSRDGSRNCFDEREGADVPLLTVDPRHVMRREGFVPSYHPPELERPEVERVIELRDVVGGLYTLEELVGQMSVEELIDVTIGLRGRSVPSLARRGIPELRHADGPNGVKLGLPRGLHGTAFPGASTRAATWSSELEYRVGKQVGREMLWAGISLWLAPGLNIHRNPLCGRNAEYYSEDPVLAGVMAAAAVKGLQSNQGVGATLKHFVANDQEAYRYTSDSIVSERALREIYLKAFEIAVRTARPWAVMTAYNRVNGVFSGNYFNLCMGVLRGEWGFDGFVMTDWWSRSYNYRAYAAGNDALMPYTDYVPWAPWASYRIVAKQVVEALKNGTLTLGQLQRSALNVLNVTLRSRALASMLGVEQEELYTYRPPLDYFSIKKSGVERG